MTTSPTFEFRRIFTRLRPAKVVVLVDRNDDQWEDICLRVIEWYSAMWGGARNLIVPTDGKVISDPFWFLLDKFDPDYVYFYEKTYLDLKLARPEEYAEWLESQVEKFIASNQNSDRDVSREWIDGSAGRVPLGHFTISEGLQRQIVERLNPFHDPDGLNATRISARGSVSYPLTDLCRILPNTEAGNLADWRIDAGSTIQLIIHSVLGRLDSFLASLGERLDELPNSPLYPEAYRGKRVEELQGIKQRIHGQDIQSDMLSELLSSIWRPGRGPLEGVYLPTRTPFEATMVNLIDMALDPDYVSHHSAPILVLGNTIDDFCFYYNLSRLRGRAFWVPMQSLRDYVDAKERSSDVGQILNVPEILPLYRLVSVLKDYARPSRNREVLVSSLSEEDAALDEAKGLLNEAELVRLGDEKEIKDVIKVSSDLNELLPYTIHAFGADNLSSYTEQFVNGESMDFVNTPKPKRFGDVRALDHYWIAEVNVEGYARTGKVQTDQTHSSDRELHHK
jgi:hypothetical protein